MVDVVSEANSAGSARINNGHIELEGLSNTRDLGGMPAADGRQIMPARLIRSGALARATKHDLDVLVNSYNLSMVIDLRTPDERSERPDPESALPGVRFELATLLNTAAAGVTREGGKQGMRRMIKALRNDPVELMKMVYSSMVTDDLSRKGFIRFFDLLLECEEGAVLWHCTAGKDRVGLATALLLHVLGTPREVILEDYEATNLYVAGMTDDIIGGFSHLILPKKMAEGIGVINSANLQFLKSAFDTVDKQYGNLDVFLSQEINLTTEKQTALRNLFLRESQ